MISWISNLAPDVDALGRLVEQQDPGDVAEPLGDDDLLLVAAAQAVGRDVDVPRP